jgi:hypothetical protein
MNEDCEAGQHEYEYVDDSFSDGFYESRGGHYECCNCGHKASTKEVDG